MHVVDKLARSAGAPIRLGLSAGGIGLSAMRAIVDEARRALGGASEESSGWRRPRPPRVWSPAPAIRRRGRSAGAARPASPAATAVAEPPPGAPPRVDDEPVPIAEVADPGAEAGAGAEVRVDPPWEGYDSMTAADVRQRLVAAESAVAAAVALYEGAGRARVSIIRAAERRLSAAARLQD